MPKNEVGLAARAATSCRAPRPGASILYCDRDALNAAATPFTTMQKKASWLAGKIYPHEIDIQETHPKHRKLDS
jgi:hypothetical protein